MPKIMIVDDEEDILHSVETVLKTEGYEVVTVNNGEECLKKLDESFSLILLDVMMPGMSSRQVIEEINKNEKLKKIKIVYLTAVTTSDDDKAEMMKLGNIVDFIAKPFGMSDLISRVKKALGE
jgi:DNA-binding response OmpR family regulator